MNLATLIVEGDEPALSKLRKALSLQTATSWKKGDVRRNGKNHSSAGFSATIADVRSPGELTRAVQTFLEQCKERGVLFTKSGVSAELSLGFTVGDSQQFVAGVQLSLVTRSRTTSARLVVRRSTTTWKSCQTWSQSRLVRSRTRRSRHPKCLCTRSANTHGSPCLQTLSMGGKRPPPWTTIEQWRA